MDHNSIHNACSTNKHSPFHYPHKSLSAERYAPQFKEKVLKYLEQGDEEDTPTEKPPSSKTPHKYGSQTIASAAAKFHVHPTTISDWVQNKRRQAELKNLQEISMSIDTQSQQSSSTPTSSASSIAKKSKTNAPMNKVESEIISILNKERVKVPLSKETNVQILKQNISQQIQAIVNDNETSFTPSTTPSKMPWYVIWWKRFDTPNSSESETFTTQTAVPTEEAIDNSMSVPTEKKSKSTTLKRISDDGGGRPKSKFSMRKRPAPAVSTVKSRKELRKQLRKAKKAQKHQYILVKCGRADLVQKAADELAGKKKKKRKKKKKKKGNKSEDQKEDEEGAVGTGEKVKEEEIVKVVKVEVKGSGKKGKGERERLDPALELRKEEEQLKLEMEEVRRKRMIEENEEEERNIRQLSKKLKLNKRANIPASFRTDGLDYLLEVCERTSGSKSKKNEGSDDDEDDEENDLEGDSDDAVGEEDLDDEMDVDDEEEENSEEGDLDAEIFGSGEEDESLDLGEDDENASDEDSNGEAQVKAKGKAKKTKKNEEKEDDGVWEDIYGRLRSKDGAVLVDNGTRTEISSEKTASTSSGKYVPPMLRGNQAKRDKIIKQLKGLLNRLSESNMHNIAKQVEEMYMANSRNEMNQTLLELLTLALVRPTIMPERVVLEHIMLIAILHANVGTEVGAFFIQSFTQQFKSKYDETELSSEDENKELENLSLITSYIYHFKIVDACLIYDILKLLGESFKAKDIEIILTILRSIGFRLRKDDPTALKDLIIMLQQKASKLQAGETGSAKVKFMLEILLAIRNNNMNKIPNYDPSFGDHLQKILKSHLHPGTYVSEMKIGLKDLLNVDKAGRWWIVGSAWTGKQADAQAEEEDPVTAAMSSEDAAKHAKLLKRARAQGMNTDARRNIFCILMTAEDYLDAFEKLNHLDLRNNQDREIIHVSTYCCLQEKRFNPYYALIASKFATTDRKLMLALQFNLWDRLKDLKSLSSHQRTNLAQLLVHLINDKSLPLSTLKIIEYTEMDKTKLKFLKKVLTGILLQKDVDNMQEIFIKPALSEKLGLFRESLRLFLSHFMLQKSITTTDGSTVESDLSPEQMEALKQRVKMAEKCMTLGKSSLL